jgi:hypothetical protein
MIFYLENSKDQFTKQTYIQIAFQRLSFPILITVFNYSLKA